MKNNLERNSKLDKIKTSPRAGEVGALLRMRGINKPAGGTKFAFQAPVILGLVPRILLKRVPNLVNKLALLLHKCWLREDSWNKSKNDWCWGRGISVYCTFFKYPSPDAKASPSPSRGEGLHRPWCQKILGTGPSMTGGRGANSFGRSMIELLGVLAIIAVLSVAGIAGYSKAMEKYKLIKYREGMVELISNFLQIKDELPTSNTTWTYNYPEIMHEMGVIPAEFEYVNKTTLKDGFGVAMNIYHDGRPGENHYNFGFHFTNSRLSSLACHELLETVIEFRNDVHELYRQPYGRPSGVDYIPYYRVWGSRFCVKGKKCLSNLTMNDIHEICYYYKGKSEDYVYAVQFYFKD